MTKDFIPAFTEIEHAFVVHIVPARVELAIDENLVYRLQFVGR